MNKRITKVTTKTGDKGTTGMADGSRLSKADPIINSIGEIDELNSLIGYLDSLPDSEDYRYVLRRIQNNPKSSQRKLAEDLGFSLGKLNYCLKALAVGQNI